MIHFSCDLCGAPIGPEDLRFEVKIEVRVAGGAACADGDEAELSGTELEEILEAEEAADPEDPEGGIYRLFRYDLCAHCHEAYLSDPLSRTRRLGLRHLEN
ncbi:MAG: hypothetical protein MUC63_06805 [Planctomycetes bacterium]|jgi:hypothetical protein|nr:hypothetical protein [Planctomycetota bacterium]